jgi:hypothetical protein
MDLFRGAMPAILADFRDLRMDKIDNSYAAVLTTRRHQRAFDKFLAEPFLQAVSRGASECYEANRVWIEALELDQQRQQRYELRRRWLVVVIKLTPRELERYVRQEDFEKSMDLRAAEAVARSRNLSTVSAVAADQPPANAGSVAGQSNSANPIDFAEPSSVPVPPDDTEELLRAALTLDDQASVEKALSELWGSKWSKSDVAHEAGVDRGTVGHWIAKKNIRDQNRIKIVDAFRRRRRR